MVAGIRCAVVLIFLLHSTSSLYEDQINKYDWKKGYVGKIKEVVFDNTMSVSKNLYVATERNAIACLSSKSGQLIWRQVLDDHVVKILQSSDGVASISSGGIVRMWDAGSGLVKWEVNLASEVKDESEVFEFIDVAILDTTYTEGNLIVILSSVGLFTIQNSAPSSPRSRVKVKFEQITDNGEGERRVYVDSETKEIIVLNINEGMSISLTIFNPKSLEIENSRTIKTAWLDNSKNVLLLENSRLLYISKQMDAIYVLDVQQGKAISQEPLSALGVGSSVSSIYASKDGDLNFIGQDFHLVSESGEVAHMRIDDENNIAVIERIDRPYKLLKIDVLKVGSEQYFFIVRQDGRNVRINGYDQTTGKEDGSLALTFTLPEDAGDLDEVFINMFLKRTSPVGYRVVITTSDDCVLMVTLPARLAWRRDEALANVVVAEMLDLPLSDIEAGIEVEFEQAEKLSIVGMFINRVQAQLGQVQSFAKQLTKGIKDGTLFEKKTKDPLIQDESLTRDPFSLHKMLVLITKCGKVFGMDSLSGEIIWRLNIATLAGKKLKLFVQRTTAHYPHSPSALVVGSDEVSAVTSVIHFNPITGERYKGESEKEFNNIIQVMLLPFTDSEYLKPFLLLDQEQNIHLIPDSQEVRKKLESVSKSVYMFNADKKTNKITGYWLQRDLKMLETFVIKIPDDQEIILVLGKDPFEKVDSMGRPLADRSVIYKYLNPNLVLVVTAAKDVPETSSTITMYLMDGVSGHIVHYVTHKKASGPVHAVHSENWVVYSYWNTKARRTEIASYELYEGKKLRNSSTFSSFDDLPGVPAVFSQAYILSGTVAAMGVSKTERGLTRRQILIGLGRGGIVGLPRSLFDPRRPLNLAQSDREEGLIPYNPEIPIHPQLLITYNKTIHGITNIYSSPSALESTTIVLATGLDLFFTRTTPSKMFDVLKEDFEYMLIIAVLSAMFIAAIVTRKMAQNKKLNKAWR